ncbi:MAG: proprotein convertase P-domain-containing protein, partial [Saprospiraceae bacterium]|nr:proprotein convertase P-domain-containing protein [Saprospiraceae bacterium]
MSRSLLPIFLLLFALNFAFAQTFPTPEGNSSNGTVGTATPITTNPAKIRGHLFPNGDIDFYSFTANAGDVVYAAVMTSFSSGNSTDSQLSLIASDGTTVIEFDDDNGSFAALSSTIAGATIPTTGTYYLKINDFTAGTTSERGYDLYLRVQSGSSTAEVEGNDTPATANALPANGWVSGARNPAAAAEQDWFSFTLNAGESVFLSLDCDPERDGTVWNGRLGLALFGDAGNQIVVVDDAGTGDVSPVPNRPSEALFITVKDAGTYFAFVDAASAATGGATATYKLSVTSFAAQSGYTNYASTDVPKTIGPGTGSVSSTITVPGNPIVKDISVRLDLNHALMQDIDAILTTPEGTQIHLFTDIGAAATGGQQQMNLFINDNNATPFAFTVLKGLGHQPENTCKLDLLKGIKAGGTWTLTLYDDVTGANGGTLNNWSLDILPETTPALIASYTNIYAQDFEANDGGYTHSGAADEWAWGTPNTPGTTTANPVAAFTTANSGVKCWKTDLTGTYNVSSNQLLESPNISIPASAGSVYLSWAMRYQVESANFDHFTVTIEEVGNPSNTQELFVWLGATPTATPGNPAVNMPLTGGWGTFYVNVSAFAGKTVRFKVRLDSDTTVILGGVAIDDVRIDAQCPDLASAPANVSIINSTCTAPTCSPTGGSITAPVGACPAGSNLQFSTDGGLTWSGTVPTYNQAGPIQNIQTRCSCVNDPLNVSPASVAVPTAPGTCPQECTCPAPTGSCVAGATIDLDADCSVTSLASV